MSYPNIFRVRLVSTESGKIGIGNNVTAVPGVADIKAMTRDEVINLIAWLISVSGATGNMIKMQEVNEALHAAMKTVDA